MNSVHKKKIFTKKSKPKIGFFTLTCCEGCQFTLLFIDKIISILEDFNIKHFNLLKEKNIESELDLAFVEGTVTTTSEIKKLIRIRKNSKFLVAMGTCACNGGIPAMKNFVESNNLKKYIYHHKKHPKSVPAAGLGEHINVDYFMRGCPIIKDEFVDFIENYLNGTIIEPFQGSVCNQCPRRGVNCFMKEKIACMGSITHGGCNALCTTDNIPCMLCRGPTEKANISGEIKLFEKFGLDKKEIHDRLNMFKNVEEGFSK
jgi:coenzyme F420-reducing hydrogenase gamma subunit